MDNDEMFRLDNVVESSKGEKSCSPGECGPTEECDPTGD